MFRGLRRVGEIGVFMRGFSAPICCGRPAARSAAASGQAPEKRRRLDELMSVLQRGDRLVVSELSRLGRSLGQITERWSGRSWGLGSNGTESTVSDRRQRGF